MVDPEAARRRREEAERRPGSSTGPTPKAPPSLAGRCLPPAAALTASTPLTQIAAAWKKQGAQGGMDLLRAHAYLALLTGSLDTRGRPAAARGGGFPAAPPPEFPRCTTAAGKTGSPPGAPVPGPGDGPAAGGRRFPAGLRGPVGASSRPRPG